MRQIVLDTETTGLSWEKGNRVVEIGCVELVERRPTGRTFQRYLDPERDFEPGAQEVTGLTREFLAGKPKFADVVEEFLAFIDGAELVIHNAAFDIGFLDNELSRLGHGHAPLRERCGVEDSLDLARQRFPGQRNSLDALCRRLGVDNSHRQLHGALLDAQLLAEAYLALTAGQGEIGFDALAAEASAATVVALAPAAGGASARPRVVASAGDLEAHAARLAQLRKKAGGAAVWDRLAEAAAAGSMEAAEAVIA
jgi:DNA polymerase-3 subunit epsilon